VTSSGPAITPDNQIQDNQPVVLPQYDNKSNQITSRYVLGPVILKGNIVSGAQAQVDPTTGQWTVQVQFTGSGGSQFDSKIAKPYYQKQVAIVLDNRVESAPTINAQQFNGQATISGGTGGFTHSQASNLALVLRYGALPLQLVQSDVQTVSATLGKNSLNAGLVAGLIGLALVLLYMILYYRALGLVVLLGLSVSAALLYSIVSYLGVSTLHQSLSLAGVVGIIVSVGVTVDSYIVYFERLKDDIRAGKSIRSSVDKSFARAWRTIWTADLVSIIAAALLFWLTVGAVRGFAFFLGLSTLLDLLVSYTFTRPMVYLLGRNRTFTEAPVLGVARGLLAAPTGGSL
jgi:preprotein translocase subunit SecD